MPQAAAGMRMDPPVSVPIEASDIPVATAIADPPLDPPGDRDGSLGLRAAPNADSSLVVPNANSCRLHLPTRTAPARRSRAVTGASADAGVGGVTCEPAVVGTPRWSTRSFREMGMPCSGPSHSPRPRAWSAAAAAAIASLPVIAMNAR